MNIKSKFQFHAQYDTMDCGPACLRMVAKYYGKEYSMNIIRKLSSVSRFGVSLAGLEKAAQQLGFDTIAGKLPLKSIAEDVPLPAIIHWKNNHFVVLYKVETKFYKKHSKTYYIADPAVGLLKYAEETFLTCWSLPKEDKVGIALLLEPDQLSDSIEKANSQIGFKYLLPYLYKHKNLFGQLFFGLAITSLLQLIFPYLTQILVDSGVKTKDVNVIYLVLAGQLIFFASRTIADLIRNWILLHIGSKINVSILSDFFIKLMKLPISFFDTKMSGDLMQRVNDHHKIERFLTGTTVTTIFSLFNLLVFVCVLSIYSLKILGTFLLGSIIYIWWMIILLKHRKVIEYKKYDIESSSQSSMLQILHGMQDIKLSNSEKIMRWGWEDIQSSLFDIKIKSMSLMQYQQGGASFINESKNIIITFLSAKAVVMGELTIGEMLSIQYIIGQLNSPLEQLIVFFQTGQDAKIGLERLNEIHEISDEIQLNQIKSVELDKSDIHFKNITFSYPDSGQGAILKNIDLKIDAGQFVAIVGSSGSGKTTLLKLLLNFYKPTSGQIFVGKDNLQDINLAQLRSQCGIVMQDGFIFSDTIANNIILGDENIDHIKLKNAIDIANLSQFIDSLPLGYNTKIGAEGTGISQGQKQRILIARAIYKQPNLLLFDEATNALDTKNESTIMSNIGDFIAGRTAIVVAHRLSTVKQADVIYVLDKGEIVERGSHDELITKGGKYYSLIKNQM